MNIIDPHLHLFSLQQGDYHWLRPENPPMWPDKGNIYRNFSEQDLALPAPLNLSGFVHIEAGFDNHKPWREIAWLESHCSRPFKSIAFAPIDSGAFKQIIDKLKTYPSVTGIRHILDEDALTLLSHKNTFDNLAWLATQQLLFEAQLSLYDTKACQLLHQLLNDISALTVIINHTGFVESANDSVWQRNLRLLSTNSNCLIKCSGFEMKNRSIDFVMVNEAIAQCLHYFGENRVMLASNFPLITLSMPYTSLWLGFEQHLTINNTVLSKLLYSNAARVYKF